MGCGLFNLPDNGYSYVQLQQLGQVTDTAVLSTSVVNETRFQFNHYLTGETAQSDAPEVIVPGDFDIGGAGINRTMQTESNYEFQNYTTVTHGKHTIKFGARTRNDLLNYNTPTNFNGTFTFASFAAYQAMVQQWAPAPRGCRQLPSWRGSHAVHLNSGQSLGEFQHVRPGRVRAGRLARGAGPDYQRRLALGRPDQHSRLARCRAPLLVRLGARPPPRRARPPP